MFTRLRLRLPLFQQAISSAVGGDWKQEAQELRKTVDQLRKEHYELMKALVAYQDSLNNKGVLSIAQATLEDSTIDNTAVGGTTPAAGSFTTVNGNTITTGTGTLTLAAGKTFTASNTLTLTGTDGTSLNINAVATLNYNTYTPTLTGGANVSASTVRAARWIRVGNDVHVTGELDLDPTSGAGDSTDFGLSLPVASNFANAWELSGVGGFYWGDVDAVVIYADTANDRATFAFRCDSANNSKLTYHFSYQVI